MKSGSLGEIPVELPREAFEGRECELSTPFTSSLFLLKCDRGENFACSGNSLLFEALEMIKVPLSISSTLDICTSNLLYKAITEGQ